MSDPRLQRAVELNEQGQAAEARGLVSSYLREFPRDAEAWGIMSQLVETPAQAIDCLERALRFADDDFTRDWAEEQLAVARGASFTPRPPTAPLPSLPEPVAPAPGLAVPTPPQDDIFAELGLGSRPVHKPSDAEDEDDLFAAFAEDKPRSAQAEDFFASLSSGSESPSDSTPGAPADDLLAGLPETSRVAPAAEEDFFASLAAAAAPKPEEDDVFAALGLSPQGEPEPAEEAAPLTLDWLSEPSAVTPPAAPAPAAAPAPLDLDLPPAAPPERETGIPSQFGGEPDFLSSLGIDEPVASSAGSGSLFDELDLPPAKAAKDEELPDLDWLESQRRQVPGISSEEEDEEEEDIFATLGGMPERAGAAERDPLASLAEPEEDDLFATIGGAAPAPASPAAETRVSPRASEDAGAIKARLRQAIALARQGQEKDAGRIVSDILEKDPENAEAWAVMAQIVTDPKLEADCLQNVIDLSSDPKAREWARERLARLKARPKPQRRGSVPLILMTLVAIVVLTAAGLVGVAVTQPQIAAMLPEPIRGLIAVQQPGPTPTLLGLPTAAPTATATEAPVVTEAPTLAPTSSPTPLPAIPAVRAIVSGQGVSVQWAPSGQALTAVVNAQGGIYTVGGSLIALGSSPARVAVFSPDGLRVASGDGAGNVVLWDAASGAEVSRISYGDTVYTLAFSPDSTKLAVGGFTGLIEIYDVASGGSVLTINPEAGDPVDLAWAPDGLSLAAVLEFPTLFGSIQVFDAATGLRLNQLETDYIISSLAYNPAGDTIAFGMRNGQVALWQPGVGAEGGVAPEGVGTPTALAPIATNTATPAPATPTPLASPTPGTPAPGDTPVAPSPTPEAGSTLLGVLVEPVEITTDLIATGPNWPFVVTDVAYAPDGQLAAARLDGTVLVWPADSGTARTVALGAGAANAIAWSPDSATLALAADSGLYTVDLAPFFAAEGVGGGGISSEGSATLPDGISGLLTAAGDTTLQGPLRALAFTTEGQGIVALLNGRAIVLDLIDLGAPEIALDTLSDMTEPVAAALSADATLALTADSTAVAWDPLSGAELATFDANEGITSAAAISPDGTRLALGGQDDNAVVIWDLTLGEALFTLSGHPASLSALAWSPDGGRLASASLDGTVVIWDAASGEALGIYGPNPATESVIALAWSLDGRQVAVSEQAGETGQIAVLDSSNARASGNTLLLASPATALIYRADGTVISGEADGTIQIWDPASILALATFSLPPGETGSAIVALAISPDGTLLASGDGAGRVAFWSLRE